jgi:hypothetical protein
MQQDDEKETEAEDSDQVQDEDDDAQHIYPAAILERENRTNNFFKTVMLDDNMTGFSRSSSAVGGGPPKPSGPGDSPSHRHSHHQQHKHQQSQPQHRHHRHPRVPHDPSKSKSSSPPTTQRARPLPPRQNVSLPPLQDPVQAGIITLQEVGSIFNNIFQHLNPFINLFDPQLHTPSYVREHCPFLYTIMIMAGCKFWMQDRFRAVQRLVEEFSIRAFLECWKRIEIVQAYMCMTYWKEPDDTVCPARISPWCMLKTFFIFLFSSAPGLLLDTPLVWRSNWA